MPPFVPSKRSRSRTPQSVRKSNSGRFVHLAPQSRTKNDKNPSSTLKAEKVHLQEQDDADDDDNDSSGMSDAESEEFESAMPEPATKRRKIDKGSNSSTQGDDDNEDDEEAEDMEWEDATSHPQQEPTVSGDLHLTLDELPQPSSTAFTNPHGQKKGPSKIERSIRINTHCMHVLSLLSHNMIRNSWICDEEVQKILTKNLPPGVSKEVERCRKACGMVDGGDGNKPGTASIKGKGKKINKDYKNQRDWGNQAEERDEENVNSKVPDPLVRLLKVLCTFWRKKFAVVSPSLRKQGYKDLPRIEQELKSLRRDAHDPSEHGERVENLEAFRNLARCCEGSRDVGAQLFAALLKGLGFETRLVNNLQPVGFGWSKSEDALPSKTKKLNLSAADKANGEKKNKAEQNDNSENSPVKPTTKSKPPSAKSKTRVGGDKDQPIDLSDDDSELSSVPDTDDDDCVLDITPSDINITAKRYDRDLPFPTYWIEVLSPQSLTWVPVDPIVKSTVASHPDQLVEFEPRGGRAEKAKQVFAYVVAFSGDGTAKDITVRYLKRHMWPGKTKGVRMPVEKVPVYNKNGKVVRNEEFDWFKYVMSFLSRSSVQRQLADEKEEATDLVAVKPNKDSSKASEETLQGYKNSAEFVLERHLRREEALKRGAKQAKTFTTGKGDKMKTEPVYRRKDVATCRTSESWHKQGREVNKGEQPLKYVPIRAVTTIRKREIEEAERESGEKQKQGLYSWDQTDWIIPPPIEDGIIPKNAYGNMDVYVPSMVPAGAVHIPLRGAAKVCRRLEIDHAEACTGFEFGNRMAVPILTGVVVAKENENMVIDAWEAEMEEKRRKESAKNEKLALNMWKKMLAGLKVLERVRKEYGEDAESAVNGASLVNAAKISKQKGKSKINTKRASDTVPMRNDKEIAENADPTGESGGGFLTASDMEVDKYGGGFILETDRENAAVSTMNTKTTNAEFSDSLTDDVSGSDVSDAETAQLIHGKKSKASIKKSKSQTRMSRTTAAKPKKRHESMDSDPEMENSKRSTGTKNVSQSNATPTRRNAARKSAEASRSRYFEALSDYGIDSED